MIDCALKVLDDAFVFKVPCSLTVAMLPNSTISLDEYKTIVSDANYPKRQDVVDNSLSVGDFAQKLIDNNVV